MRLNVQNPRLRVKVSELADGRARLTIDYPLADGYPSLVFAALAEILRSGEEPPADPLRGAAGA